VQGLGPVQAIPDLVCANTVHNAAPFSLNERALSAYQPAQQF
jgi:hypothetical protein